MTASTDQATPAGAEEVQWQRLPEALRSPAAAQRLVRDYVDHSAAEDLAERGEAQLVAAVASHVEAGLQRPAGTAVVRTVAGASSGARARRSTVEVVTDDMPFLVDSLTSSLTVTGHGIVSVAHPRLAARRDDTGRLLDLGAADHVTPGHEVEAWIRIEVDGLEPQERPALESQLTSVLDDVRTAVRDWPLMQDRALETADELADRSTADRAEAQVAARFLHWLADDRFTFLGYGAYDLAPDGLLALRPGSGLGLLTPDASGERPEQLSASLPQEPTSHVLRVVKARVRSTVHRSAYLDCVCVPVRDAAGEVTGERRLLGLFTSGAYTESVRRVPLVAEKVAEVLHRAGFAPGGHSARDLQNILEFFPRDELMQAEVDVVLRTALGVLSLQERRRTRLFLRADPSGFTSCLVFLPRDRYTTTVGQDIEALLTGALDGGSAEHTLHVTESALARLHVVVRPRPGERLRAGDEAELETAVARAVRSWEDDLLDAARGTLPEQDGVALVRRWVRGMPDGYRADVPPSRAVEDLRQLEALLDATPDADVDPSSSLALREPVGGEPRTWRLSLYRLTPVTLSAVLPYLADLGVEVTDERPYELEHVDGRTAWVYDVGLRLPRELWQEGDDAARSRFGAAFAAAWSGRAESDALNRLVLAAQLSWEQVVIVRALIRYLRQTGLPYSVPYAARTLVTEVTVTRLLLQLFKTRYDPAQLADPAERADAVATVVEQVRTALDAVQGLDADRILRALLSAVQAVLRTNAYQRGEDGEIPRHLSFKLDPAQVAGMPEPAPAYEIWVYSPRVEGAHLRFGAVARGGLRWSDRREDFRTEVLGLVKAQIVKNAVIVPTGAKGGFVGKALPDPAVDRDAWWAEGIACYRTFITGLLDVTDDLRTGADGQEVVVPPVDVVRYDGDDPYLVVAADKGTASFSDIANEIAVSRGFWLGDAFASGGSNGYDHKAMGITARGAWESVRRHFRELGVDPQTTDITVVGVGDMSGDVFGNGMLLSEHIRLVAAFDHRHVFLDPDPDPAVSFAERQRLFALPRSSWADYDPTLLSPGGGVHSRTAKSVPISPQVAVRLGLPDGTRSLSPDELVRAVLLAPVDLFWNGGIGTYVKAATESHAQVGDKANDAVRVDGGALRVRVVGEGGNLGLTQRGRVEAARSGVRLNTDAVDNSAGVDCSDHEVNIKIMLDRLVAKGELGRDERNERLRRMTDDVARLVLHNNDEQNRTLSVESALSSDLLPAHRRFLEVLEGAGAIDRAQEALPSAAELDRRVRDGDGLSGPELCVLLAHAKISLRGALLESDLPDEPWVQATLCAYFPDELGQGLAERLAEHPLSREIAATVLVNDVVAAGGLTFAFRAAEETGSDPADVVRAFAVTRTVFGLDERIAAVERLDGTVVAAVQARLRHEQQRLLDRAVRWFLQARPEGIDVAREVDRFGPALAALGPRVPALLLGKDLAAVEAEVDELVAAGVPRDEALRTTSLLFDYPMLDVVEVALATGRPAEQVAAAWFAVSDRYGFDRLLTAVSSLSRADRWETLARAALRDDLYALLREFAASVVSSGQPAADAVAAVEAWEGERAAAVRRVRQTLLELEQAGRADLTALSVALRTLRTVLRRR